MHVANKNSSVEIVHTLNWRHVSNLFSSLLHDAGPRTHTARDPWDDFEDGEAEETQPHTAPPAPIGPSAVAGLGLAISWMGVGLQASSTIDMWMY